MKKIDEIVYVEASPGQMEPKSRHPIRDFIRRDLEDPLGLWSVLAVAAIPFPIAVIALCDSLFR